MTYVLIKVSGGIVSDAVFYEDGPLAVKGLADFVRAMDPHDAAAALYTRDRLIANAKDFLDETDRFTEEAMGEIVLLRESLMYLICNPSHPLGFMVTSPDDPLGYDHPAEAVSDLGQMRKDHGKHLKLYRAIPVEGLLVRRSMVDMVNRINGVDDFDFTLVDEYVDPD